MRLTGQGEFTLHGSNVAHPRKHSEPGVEIDGFRGRVSFLGVCFTQVGGDGGVPALVVKGQSPQTKVLALSCHGSGEWFANLSPSAAPPAWTVFSTRRVAGRSPSPTLARATKPS